MRTVLTAVAIIIALAAGGIAQGLSTDVYPSEDELLEALRRGDIDQERYRILLEILREGIDSSTIHLLDEIPNLSGEETADSAGSKMVSEQAEAFLAPARVFGGRVEYRYAHEVERAGRGSYRTNLSGRLNEQLDLSLRFDRSVTGRERVVGRSLRYRKRAGLIREVALGSVSRRLGLGTIAGYRGKLLDYAEKLDGESFLYPDYGGVNGGYVRAESGVWAWEGIVSHTRDPEFALTTTAVGFEREIGRVHVRSLVGMNRLGNRLTGERRSDVKYGGGVEYRYRRGRTAAEVTGQAGMRSGFGAVVMDGYHRLEDARIWYSGWHYDDEYVDLSGGSRAGPISMRDSIPELGFAFATRRTGASGGRVRTIVPVVRRVAFETAAFGSAFSRVVLRGELLGAIVGEVSREVQVRVDHLERLTRRRDGLGTPDDVLRRTRGEVRHDGERLAVRTYLGHTTETGRSDYWSLFLRVRYEAGQAGRFELWSNIGRVDMKRGMIEYGYVYGRCSQVLWRNVESAVKVAHRYSRVSSDRHVTTVAVEVRAEW